MSGNLFIISAASGTGKTSLVKAILAADSRVKRSTSYTTRAPRPAETQAVDYHFVDETAFLQKLEAGDFLEAAQVHGARYGTSQSAVEAQLAAGVDVILEIDYQGAAQVRRLMPQAVSIFILPPSLDALSERLNNRAQDSLDVITLRLNAARDEMRHVAEFDYVTINDKFDDALADILAIIRSTRLVREAQLAKNAALIASLLK